jgi:hypothetical protein
MLCAGASLFCPLLFCSVEAPVTPAALLPDKGVKIFFAIIDGNLFSGLNLSDRPYPYTIAAQTFLGVGLTGMVDVARKIAARTAIDDAVVAKPEEIFAARFRGLFFRENGPFVFDDSLVGGDELLRLQAQSCLGALHRKAWFLSQHAMIITVSECL